jgi:hypothetical protein
MFSLVFRGSLCIVCTYHDASSVHSRTNNGIGGDGVLCWLFGHHLIPCIGVLDSAQCRNRIAE